MRGKLRWNKKVVVVAFLMIFIAFWCLLRMATPEKSWKFEAQDLERPSEAIYFEANVIDENEPGWYVDSGMEYGEVFTQTPPVTLPVGSYNITIFYKSGGEGAQYHFKSESSTYRVILGRRGERLESGRISKTMSANYTMPVEEFQVITEYTGDGYLLVNGVEIRQTRNLERMILFGDFLCAACGIIWYSLGERKRVKQILLCGIGAAAVATLPVMMPYLYKGDDLYFHLLRIEGIAEGLRAGQFPVRIQPEWMNGYGYSVSVFYGEGILWIAGVLRLIGFPLQTAYKMYIFVVSFLTFELAYFALNRITRDRWIGILGGVIYTLAPYRLMNIYGRAAVGEYTALTFLPLILEGTYEILMKEKADRKYGWLILAAGMTGIIQSHILTCEIVVLTMGITCLICFKKTFEKSRFCDFVKAVVVTVFVNMEFLLPFLDYMRDDLYVNSGEFGGYIQTCGTFFNQLLTVFPHGYGMEKSIGDGLSPEPEKTFVVGTVFILCLILFWAERKKCPDRESSEQKLGTYCAVAGCILVVMSTIWFPWDFLHDLNPILALLISRMQFPWRLLGTAGLMLTVTAVTVLWNWEKMRGKRAAAGLAAVLLGITVLTVGYYTTSLLETNDVLYVPDVESISTFELVSGEYVPEAVAWSENMMPEGKLWHSEQVEVYETDKKGTNYVLTCRNLSEGIESVELPMIYYRGYVAKDQETEGAIALEAGENGRVRLLLAGNYEGTVRVRFQEPLLWRVAEVITLLSVIGVLAYLWREKYVLIKKK